MKERSSPFDFAGGDAAFVALAAALHQRCLDDPVLNHPFSHDMNPDHLDRLAAYLGEVFGGPPAYSSRVGGHTAMLLIHAETGAEDEMATRFVTCFDLALDDASFPSDPEFRRVLHDYMVWATGEVHSYSPHGSVVPTNLAFPHWSWDGPTT
ncbi:MAG: globin domain-containing protein [Acidimicrobiales bacterium]